MENKTCGECKYYCNDSAFCSHYGVGWKNKSDAACKDFQPIPKLANREIINSLSNGRLAELFTYQTVGGGWTSPFIAYVCKERIEAIQATVFWFMQEAAEEEEE